HFASHALAQRAVPGAKRIDLQRSWLGGPSASHLDQVSARFVRNRYPVGFPPRMLDEILYSGTQLGHAHGSTPSGDCVQRYNILTAETSPTIVYRCKQLRRADCPDIWTISNTVSRQSKIVQTFGQSPSPWAVPFRCHPRFVHLDRSNTTAA